MDKQPGTPLGDLDWWYELADVLGWKIYGFSYRLTCSFADTDGNIVQLTGSQLTDIMNAINANKER